MIKYKGGYKYQLVENYTVVLIIQPDQLIETWFLRLETAGTFTIRSGYAWDGPSGPTIDTKDFMRGSLIHDAIYELIRNQLLPESCRAQADDILRIMCIEDGMPAWKAEIAWAAVRKFGAGSAHPDAVKQVLTAP